MFIETTDQTFELESTTHKNKLCEEVNKGIANKLMVGELENDYVIAIVNKTSLYVTLMWSGTPS